MVAGLPDVERAQAGLGHSDQRSEPDEGEVARLRALLAEREAQLEALYSSLPVDPQLRLLADALPVLISYVDSSYRYRYVNKAYQDWFGIGPVRIVGRHMREVLGESAFAQILPLTEKALSGERVSIDTELDYARGGPRNVHLEYVPDRRPGGAVGGFYVLVQDLSDSRRAESALRAESRLLGTLNRIGAALAAELDLERLVQNVTDAGVELSGAEFGAFFYNVIDGAGENYTLYTTSGVDRAAFESFPMPRNSAVFAATFSGHGVVRSDDITRDPRYGGNAPYGGMPPGHLPVVSYLAVPVSSRSGEVIGGLFFGHSEPGRFTERHEKLLVGIAGQAAVAIDNARLFESTQREIAERSRAEEALRDLNMSLEQRIAAAIAQRQHAEEALRQAQKMEAVGQLTGGIAHDFNNLLTVISGNLDMSLRRLGGDVEPRIRRTLANAMAGAQRAAMLTQRLLAFSRRQPLAPKPVDANALLLGMSEMLYRTLGETIEVETRLAAGLVQIEVDPHQLESALLNLAVNARDAMPEGGRLIIETSSAMLEECDAPPAEPVAPGAYVVITVSDTGEGMDEETRRRAVEPFFTTKDVGKGTGLGLSMVYGFVRQSGGLLRIDSEEGRGTRVHIYLPRLAVPPVEETPVEVAVSPRGAEETILVCEDDEDVRAYTTELLAELGYRVLEAHDGASALRLLSDPEIQLDLLFTDLVLPGGMDGAALARQAREARPGLRILFTTGYARDTIVHEGRLDAGTDLVTKPFSQADLAARVRDVLDRR